jgi:hypothetical protein
MPQDSMHPMNTRLSCTPTHRSFFFAFQLSCRQHDNHANHIIVLSCNTSSFQAMDWFCSRNSRVSFSHRVMFSGLTKSIATLMQSARFATYKSNKMSTTSTLDRRENTYLMCTARRDKDSFPRSLVHPMTLHTIRLKQLLSQVKVQIELLRMDGVVLVQTLVLLPQERPDMI